MSPMSFKWSHKRIEKNLLNEELKSKVIFLGITIRWGCLSLLKFNYVCLTYNLLNY